MLSLAAVFKDILPGYRVRLPTEKELAVAVSKDVKKVRDHESAMLRAYQVRPCWSRSISVLGQCGVKPDNCWCRTYHSLSVATAEALVATDL